MDDVFKALADGSRRKLLDRLFRRDGQTLGELCEKVDMTRFGVMKHLRVLEEAALSDLKSRLEGTMAETQVYELFIRTTPEKLWQALTDGAMTKKYFFAEE